MPLVERHVNEHELEPLVEVLSHRFGQRWDQYPKQLPNGQYITVHAPLNRSLLADHLRGRETLGAYVLDSESHARFMVLDADDEPNRRRLIALSRVLDQLSCPTYLEASRRGAHLWFFFDEPRPGEAVRKFGHGLMAYFNLSDIELFPKQNALRDEGPGSLVRLPFGVHKKSGRRYGFYTPDGEPLAPTLSAQILALSQPQTVPERLFTHYGEYSAVELPPPVFEAVGGVGERQSDRIKAAVSCYDFVRQYVQLSASGRGQCPFHDDQVASFSVNPQENYWHCFAGCGGGSIIDFYMLYQREVEGKASDFKTAVKDLVRMLLV